MNDLIIEKEKLLNITLDGLEKAYPRGLYDWLHTHDRDVYARIDEIENALNKSFAEGGTLGEFKATLRQYWDCHMQAIRLFRESGQPEAPPEVRQARIAEMETAHV